MKLSPIEIERALETPSESEGLRKARFVRDWVQNNVQAHKLDMRDIIGRDGCGCVYYHAEKAGVDVELDEFFDDRGKLTELFDTHASCGESSYPDPVGALAKAEFIARIDRLIAELS